MSVAELNLPLLADHRQPLPRLQRGALLVLIVVLHVAVGWALTRVRPATLVVAEGTPMEVRMVAEAPVPQVEELLPPPPEDTPPPRAELEAVIQPPPPDLPPPAFPVHAPPPPPKPPRPRPAPAPQAAPAQAAPQPAAAAPPAAPKTVGASQVSYLVAPHPVYPERARRAGETGRVLLRVMIDVTGRPAQAMVATSSGHAALDEAALSALRAAQFRPYVEGGLPQAVWVVIPINFLLQ
jgi:protein TonB